MPNLVSRLAGRSTSSSGERAAGLISTFDDWLTAVTYQGLSYGVYSKGHDVDNTFSSYVQDIGKRQGVVAAAIAARALLMSEVRFAYRSLERNSPDYLQLFGDRNLALLERPDPGYSTRPKLLKLAEHHVSLAGTAYFTRRDGRLELLRPDLVETVIGSDGEADDVAYAMRHGRVDGYLYYRYGRDRAPDTYMPEQVAAFAPEPDPVCWWRGQSWVTSVLREVRAHEQSTQYVSRFLDQGASPSLIVKPQAATPEQLQQYAEQFRRAYEGSGNAHRAMFLAGGADVTVVGSKIGELAIKEVQGGFETIVAARARVPAVYLGIREGLAGSSLNTGNYSAARRQMADGWFTPTVHDLCATLEALFPPPRASTELTFDPSLVMFLQEDAQDAAQILATQSQAIRTLVDGGFDPSAAVKAIRQGNLSALEREHSGLVSVQLLPPGDGGSPSGDDDSGDDAEAADRQKVLDLTTAAQKIYLAVVNKVMSAREARDILNRIGADLPPELPDELLMSAVSDLATQAPPEDPPDE